jgi:hypothetical protein
MNASSAAQVQTKIKNPYPGPRPFRVGEQLPNRQDEARELSDLLIADRVVLLHAPSGAGKTSLIQAGLIPILRQYGFRPAGPVRVDKPTSSEGRVRNRYVYSVAQYLLDGSQENQASLETLTLAEVLSRYASQNQDAPSSEAPRLTSGEEPWVLLLDQFEEILVLDPTDWEVKEQFFEDVRDVLDSQPWWVLFGMREDFMGGLDRYLDQIPGHLRATYRLDFLTRAEAAAAITFPARSRDVTFESEAVENLITRLAQVQVDAPDDEPKWLPTPYVEPFQLQVACRRLWKQVRAAAPNGQFSVISCDDVKALDVDQVLSQYYSDSVTEVAQGAGVPEAGIRQWFESQLITVTTPRLRSQTMKLPVADNPDIVRKLEDGYLVREDSRGGVTWYELEHDRLIMAVVNSNKDWRRNNYQPWQVAAYKWQLNNRPDDLLLSKMELKIAPAPRSRGLTPDEQDFLKRSNAAVTKDRLLKRHRSVTGFVTGVALAELAIILILLVLHVLGQF